MNSAAPNWGLKSMSTGATIHGQGTVRGLRVSYMTANLDGNDLWSFCDLIRGCPGIPWQLRRGLQLVWLEFKLKRASKTR